ncbi:hypothetical protein Bealeia1_00616 [Candidatus Bealeia paramacronuclearis]|uniref:RCK C-terminal domain-containing protein n=1 Tax=Candidatus Bealeia paramacronuclearis TaxID=1921001 RepID=A0ABZ2C2Z2_9PROT|nr:hypothetical protein [Candidatus Bealeia paramacronuclearis]
MIIESSGARGGSLRPQAVSIIAIKDKHKAMLKREDELVILSSIIKIDDGSIRGFHEFLEEK